MTHKKSARDTIAVECRESEAIGTYKDVRVTVNFKTMTEKVSRGYAAEPLTTVEYYRLLVAIYEATGLVSTISPQCLAAFESGQ